MKCFYLLACLLLIVLSLIACGGEDETPTAEVTPTVQPTAEASPTVQPTDTPAPTATIEATPTATPEPVLNSAERSDRPYRPYPAPTGLPGFRKYYQKRCYPGCHADYNPDQVHP